MTSLSERCDAIEECYEFMLAYAGQGLPSDEGSQPGAQLREFLRSELGNEWFARREAGDLLRELWSLGQGPSADELLKDATGAKLEMAAVADRIREGLGA